jgi:hypothetical protein
MGIWLKDTIGSIVCYHQVGIVAQRLATAMLLAGLRTGT